MHRANFLSLSCRRPEDRIQRVNDIFCDTEDPCDQTEDKIQNERNMEVDDAVKPSVKLRKNILRGGRDAAERPRCPCRQNRRAGRLCALRHDVLEPSRDRAKNTR